MFKAVQAHQHGISTHARLKHNVIDSSVFYALFCNSTIKKALQQPSCHVKKKKKSILSCTHWGIGLVSLAHIMGLYIKYGKTFAYHSCHFVFRTIQFFADDSI